MICHKTKPLSSYRFLFLFWYLSSPDSFLIPSPPHISSFLPPTPDTFLFISFLRLTHFSSLSPPLPHTFLITFSFPTSRIFLCFILLPASRVLWSLSPPPPLHSILVAFSSPLASGISRRFLLTPSLTHFSLFSPSPKPYAFLVAFFSSQPHAFLVAFTSPPSHAFLIASPPNLMPFSSRHSLSTVLSSLSLSFSSHLIIILKIGQQRLRFISKNASMWWNNHIFNSKYEIFSTYISMLLMSTKTYMYLLLYQDWNNNLYFRVDVRSFIQKCQIS